MGADGGGSGAPLAGLLRAVATRGVFPPLMPAPAWTSSRLGLAAGAGHAAHPWGLVLVALIARRRSLVTTLIVLATLIVLVALVTTS
jgi:hypothetical protein